MRDEEQGEGGAGGRNGKGTGSQDADRAGGAAHKTRTAEVGRTPIKPRFGPRDQFRKGPSPLASAARAAVAGTASEKPQRPKAPNPTDERR